jgi:hypothetical protein
VARRDGWWLLPIHFEVIRLVRVAASMAAVHHFRCPPCSYREHFRVPPKSLYDIWQQPGRGCILLLAWLSCLI